MLTRQFRHSAERSVVGRFGKHNPSTRHARAHPYLLEKAHSFVDRAGIFARSAAATAGCTRSPISPRKRATSRTRLALMYVVSSEGTMKTVSSFGERCRFMSAI